MDKYKFDFGGDGNDGSGDGEETRQLEDTQTFREWLILQRRRHDSLGDFARSVATDSCMPAEAQSVEAVSAHIQEVHGVDLDFEMGEVVDRARQAYERRGEHYLSCAVWEGGRCNCLLPGLMKSLREGSLFK